jgi:hypothetical protein
MLTPSQHSDKNTLAQKASIKKQRQIENYGEVSDFQTNGLPRS